ncbi:microsomal glutathione S-transferase 3-like [Zingiber officinale]|uniref:Glutathione S-transferase 3, mitochondrial n=1 Tax=Zingiber officinale TaxID=94328 RepID=A0A8J5GCZ1_ZINOF|nr:microsomal glutathione S-transferase 3-like [Zingiber officinale]KAG6503416.1 hypothetical protein ZIOFF_035729 [Zingiber officinale]
MGVTFEIPNEYGFVVLVLVSYVVLNAWMAIQVGKARRRYNVPYPSLYAIESENKDAKLFNCVQRGHQNSLEMIAVFFATLLVAGLQFPVAAAAIGALYTVARWFYFKGYSTGVPENRHKIGWLSFLAIWGLIIITAAMGISLIVRDLL